MFVVIHQTKCSAASKHIQDPNIVYLNIIIPSFYG